jgi:hypothetical protein
MIELAVEAPREFGVVREPVAAREDPRKVGETHEPAFAEQERELAIEIGDQVARRAVLPVDEGALVRRRFAQQAGEDLAHRP